MSTPFKVIRQTLLDYMENPHPLTAFQEWCLNVMIDYHAQYNAAYNAIGAGAAQEEQGGQGDQGVMASQEPSTTPSPLLYSPVSSRVSADLQGDENEERGGEGASEAVTTTPFAPRRRPRSARLDRTTLRPRRLFASPESSSARAMASEDVQIPVEVAARQEEERPQDGDDKDEELVPVERMELATPRRRRASSSGSEESSSASDEHDEIVQGTPRSSQTLIQ